MAWKLGIALATTASLAFSSIGQAQNTQTLADIRQDLAVLFVEIQKLNRELSTTGASGTAIAGASVLERVDLIEAELQRLTALTEELQFRVGQVVRDGTNRVGDLEFRLCEVEPNCDIADLGDTPSLGGLSDASPQQPQVQTDTPQLAVGERADFDRAKAALDANDWQTAADLFLAHAETYPGGALTAEAQFLRGEALSALGSTAPAARSYLQAFSSAPTSPTAPDALLRLGESLGDLGQVTEACVTLGEVQVRFPDSTAAFDAGAARRALNCS